MLSKSRIKEFAKVGAGQGAPQKVTDFSNEGIPFIRAGSVEELLNGCDEMDLPKVNSEIARQYRLKLYQPDTIVFAKSGMSAMKGRIYKLKNPCYVVNHLATLELSEKAFPDYVVYALREFSPVKLINDISYPSLKQSKIGNHEIPFPDYSTQRHIANILSKAENLIAQRKESIALLDEFLKSTFLEMFGDPVRNEKGWEISSLAEFGSFKNGLNYTRNESGISVRCLGVGDFKALSKITDIESLQMLNLSTAPSKEYFLQNGDLVFVRSNGNRELVGRCLVIYPERNKVTFSGFCIRYRANDDSINTIYLSHLFRIPIFRTSMLQNGKGANIQNINQKVLGELKIPTPPIELQTQFAQIVEKTEVLKAQYQQSLQELENLYGSLSQRAFKGELKLDKNEEDVLMAAEPEPQYQTQSQLSIPPSKKGFAKLVLAGKIINECKDSPEFTNIKFQKLQHLAEHLMEADLNLNYYNQAAGPYDNKFMHTLHNKMKQQKWFASRGYKYSPLEKSNDINGHFSRYFGNNNEQFSKLIKLLGKASEDQCEIISTLYAVWNDRIIKKEPITNEGVIQDFFNWSDRKQKYTSRQLTKAIEWMKENGLEPKGFGELIKHAKKKKKNN